MLHTILRFNAGFQFEQTDANVTVQNIEKVTEWSKNLNNREIKGINKRLSYLDHHLRQAEGASLFRSHSSLHLYHTLQDEVKR